MNLFGRRPLCIFCFLFFMTALMFYGTDWNVKLKFACAVGVFSLLLLCLGLMLKKIRAQLFVILLCLSGILFSLVNSYIQIDNKQNSAQRYAGEHAVAMTIIKNDGATKSSSEYLVDITYIGEQKISLRGLLLCPFATDLSTGDRVYAKAELVPMSMTPKDLSGYRRTSEDGVYMMAVLQNAPTPVVERIPPDASFFSVLFQPSGIRLAAQKVSDRFSSYIDRVFDGSNLSTMVKSIFVGDTSSVDDLVMRDFRRCGLSHLMSVSGLHFSILLGMISWILQLIRLPKSVRCVVSAAFAIVFLILTNFALSACRSAIMVLAVYWNFLFMEDHDSPTALFAAMMIIVWLSPHSVADLGLWMSFLATLGLVTVFPLIENIMPYWKHKNKFLNFSLRIARNAILGVAITLIANLFLIPIYWVFFGEISIVTILANLLVSPLAFWLLPMIVFALLCANIPLLGNVFVWIVSVLFKFLLGIARWLSGFKLATLPLNDAFSDAIIPVFTVMMLLVLLLPIRKHKWILGVPSVFIIVSLTAFQIWLHIFGTPTLTYTQLQRSDSLIIQEKGKTVVCSISDGSQTESYLLLSTLRDQSAVCIDTLIFSHYTPKQDEILTYLNNYMLIERLALPYPQSKLEMEEARELAQLVDKYGIKLLFFENNQSFSVTDSVRLSLNSLRAYNDSGVEIEVFGEKSQAKYLSASNLAGVTNISAEDDAVFFGIYGNPSESNSKIDLRNRQGNGMWFFPYEMKKWSQNLLISSEGVFCFREEIDRKSVTVDFP